MESDHQTGQPFLPPSPIVPPLAPTLPPPAQVAFAGGTTGGGCQLRCAGCKIVLTVGPGWKEFLCPSCHLTQMLPPDLIQGNRARVQAKRKQPQVPTHGVDPTKIQLPCVHCNSILNVPRGLSRFTCPQCHNDLAVDLSKIQQVLPSPLGPVPPEEVNEGRLPQARVIYCSATGASEPRNMGYMVRLGLWGAGTSFTNFKEFLGAMAKGGVGALELVAMDMKARGMYLCRTLSYKCAEFEVVEVQLEAKMTCMHGPNCKWGSFCTVGRRRQEVNVLGGLILPVWGAIEKALSKQARLSHRRIRVVRIENTTDNQRIVGLLIPIPAVEYVLQDLAWVQDADD